MKSRRSLHRLISQGGIEELIRFNYLGEDSDRYSVTFIGICKEEWSRIYNDFDPRDVKYMFEFTTGERVAFANLNLIWHSEKQQMWIRNEGWYTTRPPRHSFDFGWLSRRVQMDVPQERAPITWERARKRQIISGYHSGEPVEVAWALSMGASHSRATDISWLLPLLMNGLDRKEVEIRLCACEGLGEIARLHGYSDLAVQQALECALEDSDVFIKRVASQSLDEIRRFVTSENRIVK